MDASRHAERVRVQHLGRSRCTVAPGTTHTCPVIAHALLLSDTHLRAGQADRLLARLDAQLDDVDAIVHAGDIVDLSILDALAARAPTALLIAISGNNDVRGELPEREEADIGGCRVGVVHDSGPAAGRARRLRRMFPSCDLVVFGHSHLPWHAVDVSPDGHVQLQVNPGSAMLRRRTPTCTVATVAIVDGLVVDVRHVDV